MSLLDFQDQFKTEEACLTFLEEQRWKNGRFCPHCGSYETYKFKDGKLFKCQDCKKQFTVKVGTIFSDSHVPLTKWFYAIYLNTSLKKGISSIQLSKYLGITQKSAWFMLQRIRYGVEAAGRSDLLNNIVEVDETYVGGKQTGARRGPADKAVVFGAVERGGKAMIKHVPSSGVRVLIPEIQKNISPDATIYSDQYGSYKSLKRRGYTHTTVNHSKLEFARGLVHTNTIEGAWAHFKLGIAAIYLGVSVKHLQLYCSEFEYRYNTKEMTDYERFASWFSNCRGRVTYKKLIA
jgi:transposase-like protein